ncbi:MAG TPA: chemotaxis protein CheB [Flavisolibacter sp.]|nr:chemotaxis protein CheB [Flavisolibacter sp.]
MVNRDIIVIGTSAGGVTALMDLVGTLPPDLDASIFVVQHIMPQSQSNLPHILNRNGPLLAKHASDGEIVEKSRIYVAPPDHHLILEQDKILVKRGPKENRFRPSIDALFRSAAYEYGPRVIGVVLSGLLDDGTSGLWNIKRFGGAAIVQDPHDAEFPSMPSNALEYVEVDHVVTLKDLGPLLNWLTKEEVPAKPKVTKEEATRVQLETYIASQKNAFDMGVLKLGNLTPFTCPECNGTLIEIKEGNISRYRCHTGHGFTSEALLSGISQAIEENIWQTIKGLEEAVMLLETMGHQLNRQGKKEEADAFFRKSRQTLQRSEWLHAFVTHKEDKIKQEVRK